MGSPRVALAGLVAFVLGLGAVPAHAAVYRVGPSQPFATPSDVHWESLNAGEKKF